MTPDHASRGHATWSASATARNWHCPGALALAPMAGEGKESIHSARGTACHEVAENCLRTGKDAVEFLGTVVRTKEKTVEIDEELAESAQVYVDYVRGRRLRALEDSNSAFFIEQRFSLDALSPPFDAGGTADAVIYFGTGKLLEVVDLKNGMSVVDPKDNPQLRTYALGAMLANPQLDVDRVTVTIVQPRAPHRDGRIRTETFHVADLIEWSHFLLAAMDNSERARIALPSNGNSVLFDEWADLWLVPGKCGFCPAEGFCPKLRKNAVKAIDPALAAKWFDDVPVPSVPAANMPDMNDPAVLARDLDGFEAIESWIKARRALAHTQAERGVVIPGYILAEKVGNRKWACPDEAKVAADLAKVGGLTDDQIYDRKLRSPAAIDKVLGKAKDRVKLLWHRPVTGTNLVSETKTTRPPARPKAEQFLDEAE